MLLSISASLLCLALAQKPGNVPPPIELGSAERIEADIRKLVSFGTRSTLSETESDTRGIGAARRWLRDEMESISKEYHDNCLRVELEFFDLPPGPRTPDGIRLANVVAYLAGSDPNRLIVISGHYDSMPSSPTDGVSDAPGANDDASGTAAVLEAARLLSGWKPRANVVFMAVAGEEQGLLGAAAQAKHWKEQGKHVEAMFTMDIVGGAVGTSGKHEPMRLRVFSEGVPSKGPKVIGSDNDAPSRQVARYLKRTAEATIPGFELTLILRQDRYLRGGDHRAFNQEGWAAVRMTEPHENYTHQHQDVREEEDVQFGDLPEFVDFAYVGRVATSVASAIAEMASAPAPPKNVVVSISKLTPNTTLKWKANVEEDLGGYAVLVRHTNEKTWTERHDVGKVTSATLEGYSKDDYLFAVESYDKLGHRSLPVYPTPRR
jgi:hypothetical protein